MFDIPDGVEPTGEQMDAAFELECEYEGHWLDESRPVEKEEEVKDEGANEEAINTATVGNV
jgi:hypothetical protein